MLINRVVPFGAGEGGAGGPICKISDTGCRKPFFLFLKRRKPIKNLFYHENAEGLVVH